MNGAEREVCGDESSRLKPARKEKMRAVKDGGREGEEDEKSWRRLGEVEIDAAAPGMCMCVCVRLRFYLHLFSLSKTEEWCSHTHTSTL